MKVRTCILMLLTLLLLAGAAACSRKPKILRQDAFGDLYADMLLADEWVKLHPEMRRDADTMLVYAEAFKRHGVSPEDVRASLEYYLQDPLRYSRAMAVTLKSLEQHAKVIRDEIERTTDIRVFQQRFRKGAKLEEQWHPCYPDPEAMDSVALRVPGLDTVYWQRRDSVLRAFPAIYRPRIPEAASLQLQRRDSL